MAHPSCQPPGDRICGREFYQRLPGRSRLPFRDEENAVGQNCCENFKEEALRLNNWGFFLVLSLKKKKNTQPDKGDIFFFHKIVLSSASHLYISLSFLLDPRCHAWLMSSIN